MLAFLKINNMLIWENSYLKRFSASVICKGKYKNWRGIKLNKKIVAISLVLLLTTIYATSVSLSTVKAQGQGWITSYDIYDYNSNQHLAEFNSATGINQTLGAIVPGAVIKVTFTVNVFTAGSGNLKLSTSLLNPPQGQYWTLSPQSNYTLGNDFNPNSKLASFNWVQGTFIMTVAGTVPTPSASAAQAPLNVVSLYGPTSGIPLDQITISSTTAAMSQFLTLYNEKNAHLKSLESSGVVQGYIDIYTSVLNNSQAVANSGDVTDAINMLNSLSTSNEPMSSTVQSLYLPIIVVLAVVAVVFVVMFMRVRGKVSYFQLVVEDQIKDLEGLTLRVSKIDRSVSSSLESVKDRLKRLVGM